MGWLSPEFHNLKELFLNQLKDIYDAEHRIVDALPDMEAAASSAELKEAFRDHCKESEEHIRRLEEIFQIANVSPERETCAGMKGLIEEGNDIASAKGDDATRDAGLIAAAQRVEHYEIAVYGTLRTFAQQMGHSEIASKLEQTLQEEEATDKKLTQIAERSINMMAQH